MSDLHIDDFYRDVAKILVILYGHFPRKMTLYVDDIAGPDTPDEFGLHSPRHEACLHTMLWLQQHGYLNYETLVRQEAIDQVVLSHTGFLTLCQNPNDQFLENRSAPQETSEVPSLALTWISVLREELKTGTSFSLAEAVKQVLQQSLCLRA